MPPKLIVLTFLAHLVHVVTSGYRDEGDTSLGRLPTDLSPIHYVLEIQPDIYTGEPPFFFNGSVSIRFVCEVATSVVYLNSKGLNIDGSRINITIAPDSPVTAPDPGFVKYEEDSTLQFLKIFVDNDLVEGAQYLLSIIFDGTMKDVDFEGLFWSSYVSILDGSTHYVASTQLESHGGREVFPCFDEPSFKATFDITILRSPDVISLSNGDLLRSEDRGDGWIADVFNTTQKMALYLVSFVVGEFEYLESYTASGTRVRVYARPEYVHELAFAHDIAAAFQDWYEAWTGIVDPNSKVDHIAVPGRSGAMENWGLITYSESYLMYNSSTDYLYDGRSVAAVIGHELAHFWFGDLVTMSWWDDIWLNEGFASYFESLPFRDILGLDPEMQAILEWIRSAMSTDSEVTSTPIRPEVTYPWEAEAKAFDSLIYSKGCGIIRMINQFLGEGTFRRAIQQYLADHAYSTVDTDSLWTAMTNQADIDGVTDTDGTKLFVKEKMDPWVDQRGYPLVNVTLTGPGRARAEQTQFLNPQDQMPPPSPFLYEWYIPLTVTNQETQNWSTITKDWLNRENKDIVAGLPNSTDQWYIVNIDQLGFYRVKYSTESYMKLIEQLDANASVIPPIVRYSIHNDAVHFVRSGLELETYAMEVTRFLDQEETLVVWDSAERGLRYPARILARYNTTEVAFMDYMRTKLDPAYNKFGWDNGNDDAMRQEARAIVLELSCDYGNPECQQAARERFADYMENPNANSIPPDQRPVVYCTAMATGTEAEWNFLHSQYLAIASSPLRSAPAEVGRILTALACALDEALLRRYINYTFDPEQILPMNANSAVHSIGQSAQGRWVMWENLQNNWNNTPTPPGVSKLETLKTVAKGFATEQDVTELENFMAAYPPVNETESSAYDVALDTAKTNKQWADDNELPLRTWFNDHTEPGGSGSGRGVAYPGNVRLTQYVPSYEVAGRYRRRTR